MADIEPTLGFNVREGEQQLESFIRKAEARKVRVGVDVGESGGPQTLNRPAGGYAMRPGTEAEWSQWKAANQPRGPVNPAGTDGPATRAAREQRATWLTERDVVGGGGRGLSGIPLGQIGRIGTVGSIARASEIYFDSFQEQQREYRLAIGARGGEDSLRKYKADVAEANAVESAVPIASKLGGVIREFFTGDREKGQATIEAAERQAREDARKDRAGEVRQQARDFFRDTEGRSYTTLGVGEADRARRAAEVDRNERLETARRERDKAVGASVTDADRKGFESRYQDATKGIEDAFKRTTERIARAADIDLRSITDQGDVSRLRGVGQDRAADRLELKRSILRQIDAEEDPLKRRALREAGVERVDAMDRINARADRFLTQGLEDQVAVTGLEAARRPFEAQAEAIYRRGKLEADKLDIEHPEQAKLVREATRNELRAYKNQLDLNGQGVEVPAGTFGPGGTAYGGSGRPDDSGAASQRTDELIALLKQVVTNTAQGARTLEKGMGDDSGM